MLYSPSILWKVLNALVFYLHGSNLLIDYYKT